MKTMKMDKDLHLFQKISLVAELYYTYGLTQQQIADKLQISRPWVSKLLKKAEELGLVRVDVITSTSGVKELEEEIQKKYRLKGVKVIKKAVTSDADIVELGKAAANYFISILEPNDVIGVSWGKTLSALANHLIPIYYPDTTVVPLIGGMGHTPSLLSNHIAMQISSAISGKCLLLHAPAFASNKHEKEVFLKNPLVSQVIEKSENIDIALVGLGSLWNSTILEYNYITVNEIKDLEKVGAIGDIALHFIDASGRIVSHPIHERLIAGNLSKIRKSARIMMGVAGGLHKKEIVKAALVGKWIDILVTDIEVAHYLIEN